MRANHGSNEIEIKPTGLVSRCAGVTAVLAACGAALIAVSQTQLWPQPFDLQSDPSGPLLLGLRVILGILGLWVGSLTLLTIFAHRSGHHRQADRFARLLPSMVQRVLRTAIGVGLSGALLLNGSALANDQTPSRERVTEQAGGQGASPLGQPQQPSQQQRGWPLTKRPIVPVDNDIPILVVRGTLDSTEHPASTALKQVPNPGTNYAPLAGGSSLPRGTIPGVASAPVTTSPPTTPAPTTPAPTTPAYTTPAPTTRGPLATVDQAANIPLPVVMSDSQLGTSSERFYTVKPGDHFWSIAETEVRRTYGAASSDEAIATYWNQLVDLNRSSLHDPRNPDLLRIGDRLRLA
jgi:hypothetical protein